MKQDFTITRMQEDDVEAATKMRLQSWLDTYVNDAAGVSRAWIEERNQRQMSPERLAARKALLDKPKTASFVAKNAEGEVIGGAWPYEDEQGVQHVGSLYVDKKWHGKGVGGALMQKIIQWSDPKKPIVLGVVTYNERAKAFYRKWGFEEIKGSDTLFDNTLPEIMMERKGDTQ
jgi:GNAT superfamily N-acetyltransferase